MSRDKLWPEGYVEELGEELYIDALEGELDAEFEKDLAIWLKNSSSAGELEKLSQIRQGLKNSDDVVIPENPAYFDALEARIMASLDAAIDSGDVKDRTVAAPTEQVASDKAALKLPLKNKKSKSKNQVPQGLVAQAAKLQRRSVSIRAGQLAIFAGVALLMTGKWLVGPTMAKVTASSVEAPFEASVANQLRATHRASSEVLTGTVISFESEADLALEIAARRLVAYHKGE